MAINDRKMFRQKLNLGGALVPLTMNAARQGLKKPLWNMLKFGALPWALDQGADLMDMDLSTQKPATTSNPNDNTTATLDLSEQIDTESNNLNNNNGPENPPAAAGNVDLSNTNATLPSNEASQDSTNAAFNNDSIGQNSVVSNAISSMDLSGNGPLQAGTIFPENESLSEVKAYADSLRGLLGDDKGQRMANTAMLAQLGMALMTGKSLQGGTAGFLDVAGQAGLQVAPMMIQMGVEQSKQDRELGLAAFQIWKEEKDAAKKTSGSFYNMYQVGYEFDPNTGKPKMLANGQPRYSSNTFRDVVQQNSPSMTEYLALNKDPKQNPNYPFPMYIPISQSASESGSAGLGGSGASGLAPNTAAGAQDQLKFSKYIYSNMDDVYRYINIAMDKQHLIGAKGELGQFGTAPAYYFNELLNGGSKSSEQFMSESKGMAQEAVNNLTENYMEGSADPSQGFGIVNDAANSSMGSIYGKTYTGTDLPVFVDYNNAKGQNIGVSSEKPYGQANVYLVKGELDRMFTDPDIPGMQVFERTLGLLLARSRQPTGRMLADVLRASFQDASVSGFTGADARPDMVINKLWSLANKLEGDMQSGFLAANVISSDRAIKLFEGGVKEAQSRGYTVDDTLFNFPEKEAATNKFYQLYFSPQPNGQWVEKYTNFPTGTTPGDWAGSKGNTIGISKNDDNISLLDQFNKELELLNGSN
mgnify:FL=1